MLIKKWVLHFSDHTSVPAIAERSNAWLSDWEHNRNKSYYYPSSNTSLIRSTYSFISGSSCQAWQYLFFVHPIVLSSNHLAECWQALNGTYKHSIQRLLGLTYATCILLCLSWIACISSVNVAGRDIICSDLIWPACIRSAQLKHHICGFACSVPCLLAEESACNHAAMHSL